MTFVCCFFLSLYKQKLCVSDSFQTIKPPTKLTTVFKFIHSHIHCFLLSANVPLLETPKQNTRERERETKHKTLHTCKWLFTWANVRSFTSMTSRTDFGVAPKIHQLNNINISIMLVFLKVVLLTCSM